MRPYNIGIVAEGPRDIEALEQLVDLITGVDNVYQYLQPEGLIDPRSPLGNGWKAVWKWCENIKEWDSIKQYMEGITPRLDLIVIQVDADIIVEK